MTTAFPSQSYSADAVVITTPSPDSFLDTTLILSKEEQDSKCYNAIIKPQKLVYNRLMDDTAPETVNSTPCPTAQSTNDLRPIEWSSEKYFLSNKNQKRRYLKKAHATGVFKKAESRMNPSLNPSNDPRT